MPGEQVLLADDAGGRIGSFVAAIGRFPAEPKWVVVGGFAVTVRLEVLAQLGRALASH